MYWFKQANRFSLIIVL